MNECVGVFCIQKQEFAVFMMGNLVGVWGTSRKEGRRKESLKVLVERKKGKK